MKLILTSDEAQIIVDELSDAIRAKKNKQPEYALKIQEIKDKILFASHENKTTLPVIEKRDKNILIKQPRFE